MVQYSQMSSPFLVETLQGFIGQMLVVQQTGNHVKQGILTAVMPDYIVLDVCRTPFFIRTEEIVWVTPLRTRN